MVRVHVVRQRLASGSFYMAGDRCNPNDSAAFIFLGREEHGCPDIRAENSRRCKALSHPARTPYGGSSARAGIASNGQSRNQKCCNKCSPFVSFSRSTRNIVPSVECFF